MKTVADKIRAMSDKELTKFLWWFSIQAISSFFDDNLKEKRMNAKELAEYLTSDVENWIDFEPKENKQ